MAKLTIVKVENTVALVIKIFIVKAKSHYYVNEASSTMIYFWQTKVSSFLFLYFELMFGVNYNIGFHVGELSTGTQSACTVWYHLEKGMRGDRKAQ